MEGVCSYFVIKREVWLLFNFYITSGTCSTGTNFSPTSLAPGSYTSSITTPGPTIGWDLSGPFLLGWFALVTLPRITMTPRGVTIMNLRATKGGDGIPYSTNLQSFLRQYQGHLESHFHHYKKMIIA